MTTPRQPVAAGVAAQRVGAAEAAQHVAPEASGQAVGAHGATQGVGAAPAARVAQTSRQRVRAASVRRIFVLSARALLA